MSSVWLLLPTFFFSFFFFNDTATTEIYTLSLHDALPISNQSGQRNRDPVLVALSSRARRDFCRAALPDRKSTRLNSSHSQISYAVFCLKKKKISTTFIPVHDPDVVLVFVSDALVVAVSSS